MPRCGKGDRREKAKPRLGFTWHCVFRNIRGPAVWPDGLPLGLWRVDLEFFRACYARGACQGPREGLFFCGRWQAAAGGPLKGPFLFVGMTHGRKPS